MIKMHAHDLKKIHMEKNNKEVASILGSLCQSTHVILQKQNYLRAGIFYNMQLLM
jgi:hypothetical protein